MAKRAKAKGAAAGKGGSGTKKPSRRTDGPKPARTKPKKTSAKKPAPRKKAAAKKPAPRNKNPRRAGSAGRGRSRSVSREGALTARQKIIERIKVTEGNPIYNWETSEGEKKAPDTAVGVHDDTLSDGLAVSNTGTPLVGDRISLLRRMHVLGIESAGIGHPGSSPKAFHDSFELINALAKEEVDIQLVSACSTDLGEIAAVAEIQNRSGRPMAAEIRAGVSLVRQTTEGVSFNDLLKRTAGAVSAGLDQGLEIHLFLEDAARTHPEHLDKLMQAVYDCGAERFVLSDSVGHATPSAVANLVTFAAEIYRRLGADAALDWHGMDDRGFALANAVTAAETGATRLHGTALGIGERVGTAAVDLLLMNLNMMGRNAVDLKKIPGYAGAAARMLGVKVRCDYPALGRDAFATGAENHAEAVLNAASRGDEWLANRIYSCVPANEFGLKPSVKVGPESGKASVIWWLLSNNIEPRANLVEKIYKAARGADNILSDRQIKALIQ